jgi:hypothetical protein
MTARKHGEASFKIKRHSTCYCRNIMNKCKGIAGDRNTWKLFMDALCSTRVKGLDDDDDNDNTYYKSKLL